MAHELNYAWWPIPEHRLILKIEDLLPTRNFNWLELDGDFDLFGDGAIQMLKTPGHTPGECSLFVRLPNRKVVLTGDTTHLRAALEGEITMPGDVDPDQAVALAAAAQGDPRPARGDAYNQPRSRRLGGVPPRARCYRMIPVVRSRSVTMPLYEWECLACDITFEDLVPVSEGSVERACPSCGRMSPRVVSTFAIASGAVRSPKPPPPLRRAARPRQAADLLALSAYPAALSHGPAHG